MRFITLFAASLALGSAAAAPAETSLEVFVESAGEMVLNPAMYTTENFTASDGETYEITYLSELPDLETRSTRSAFQRRQQSSDDPQNRWRPGTRFRDSCPFGSINDDTGPNAPTTGRCAAVRDWCASNPGNWAVFPQDGSPTRFYPLISSGRAGTTACHFAVRADGALTQIGSDDVRDWARESLNRYRRTFNGVERVRSYGSTATCIGVRPRTLWWKLDTLQGIGQ
ncbi:hypothetical protein MCOR25_010611 [Pyricularia grisea]|uniref:Ecp2 effector protein-like domain-containing protein n=1 Tax=Pyricularia grisea TaxID=148305 RepID=A0A6P8AQW1_PYRGI|nr:uncharacterized protein PgNI_11986 [Pyricularia grisea]KAI6350064.1 hypothetical protein MCOR25_010611 [Pyricularia grisea]TLD04431.1 hypothetical protein PgNI_11986 [Pyricularia grisea]